MIKAYLSEPGMRAMNYKMATFIPTLLSIISVFSLTGTANQPFG
jgi:hypothetical protein